MAVRAGMLWGPLTAIGLATAAITCVLDQASKLWLLKVFDLANQGVVKVAPFVDLVLTWNTGISYGLFPQESDFGRYVLLALKAGAVLMLWIWLARAGGRIAALSLGLIIGGALGNGIDRLAYGAVADFILVPADDGAGQKTVFIIDTSARGVSLQPVTIGLSGARAAHLTLDKVTVIREDVLGQPGHGSAIVEWR